MYTLKLRRVGNSLGLTLPREALAELGVGEGDTVFLTRTPEGFALTPYDETFAAALDAFAAARGDLRNALRALAAEQGAPRRRGR